MKLLFAHDHIFFSSSNGNIYSAAAYPQESWTRYLNHFSEILVIGRYGGNDKNASSTLVLSSRPNVSFKFVPKISSPTAQLVNKHKVWKDIVNLVLNSDAVIARLPSENGLLAIKAARKYNRPFAVEVVGCVWDALWNYGSIVAKLYAPLAYLRMKVTISNSFRILYVTDRFLQSRYPSPPIAKTVNASNVDLAEYNRDVLKQRLAKPAKEIIVFGMIGNFKTTYKGVHTAIEALSQIKDKYKFVFKVLGKGDTLKYINLAKDFDIDDYVFFCGSLPNGRPVLNWLDQLDIYLQPSLAEGLPRALIEAMSRGLPCVASKTGGIPELLEPRFLHNPGNAKDLKNKILYILSLNLSEISKENFDRVKQYNSNSLNKKRFVFFEDLKNAAIRNLQ